MKFKRNLRRRHLNLRMMSLLQFWKRTLQLPLSSNKLLLFNSRLLLFSNRFPSPVLTLRLRFYLQFQEHHQRRQGISQSRTPVTSLVPCQHLRQCQGLQVPGIRHGHYLVKMSRRRKSPLSLLTFRMTTQTLKTVPLLHARCHSGLPEPKLSNS